MEIYSFEKIVSKKYTNINEYALYVILVDMLPCLFILYIEMYKYLPSLVLDTVECI